MISLLSQSNIKEELDELRLQHHQQTVQFKGVQQVLPSTLLSKYPNITIKYVHNMLYSTELSMMYPVLFVMCDDSLSTYNN